MGSETVSVHTVVKTAADLLLGEDAFYFIAVLKVEVSEIDFLPCEGHINRYLSATAQV